MKIIDSPVSYYMTEQNSPDQHLANVYRGRLPERTESTRYLSEKIKLNFSPAVGLEAAGKAVFWTTSELL